MPENRRRRIIKTYDPHKIEEERDLYDEVKEPLLERKIYVPTSLIFGGFLAIILMSFSLTFLIMTWGGDPLELEENGRLAAFREAAAETTLEIRQSPGTRPFGVARPEPQVDVGGLRLALPSVSISGIEAPERRFQRQAANRTFAPVADLSLRTPGITPMASIASIAIPGARRGASSFDRALAISPPRVDLTPRSFRRNFETASVPQTTQKLMMRRFAKATSLPEATGAVNPLTVPLNGQGLEENNRSFDQANGTMEPVSDLAATRQASTNASALSIPANARLTEKGRDFDSPLSATFPVADLSVTAYPPPRAVPEGQTSAQKLLIRRYAKASAPPEAATGNNPLTIPLQGEQIGTRSRNFSRALGLDAPTTDLVLSAGILPGIQGPAVVPDQKLLARRFAKATSIPERLPVPGATETLPVPDPVLENNSIARGPDLEPWQRFAARVPPDIEGQGRIVIIIDDMGNNSNMAARLAELDGPLNFAFLPYAPNLARQTSNIRRRGHELLVHMPMEPTGNENPGPRALTTQLSDTELLETLEWNLTRFEGFVGVNNHMGSRFTADQRRMEIVMKSLKERGLLFLDSLTTNSSKGPSLAKSYNIPWAGRDIFIDNEINEGAILNQLRKVEQVANQRGIAIAIGHPHSETYRALKAWLPTLKGKGLVLVPLSSVVRASEPRKLAGGG